MSKFILLSLVFANSLLCLGQERISINMLEGTSWKCVEGLGLTSGYESLMKFKSNNIESTIKTPHSTFSYNIPFLLTDKIPSKNIGTNGSRYSRSEGKYIVELISQTNSMIVQEIEHISSDTLKLHRIILSNESIAGSPDAEHTVYVRIRE